MEREGRRARRKEGEEGGRKEGGKEQKRREGKGKEGKGGRKREKHMKKTERGI